MSRRYHVEFDVEGTRLGDDCPLSELSISNALMQFDVRAANPYLNREINTRVKNVRIRIVQRRRRKEERSGKKTT